MSHESVGPRVAGWISRQSQRRIPYSQANPFLAGPYAPVAEERTETALTVTGRLPPELNGTYLRIGPNPMQVANPATYHWFLGDGMVHGVRLEDGAARWYRNRWVGVDAVNDRLGRVRAPGPRRGLSGTVNTNIIRHAGSLWALVEAGALPVQLNSHLETVGHGYFGSALSRSFSAHPRRDPATGELHAVCYEGANPRRIHYVVIDARGQVSRLVDVPVRHGPMIHDCAITERYALILDLPVTFSLGEFLAGAAFPYKWNPRHAARVGLLPRQGEAGDIRWCAVDPCYVFHICNAFDLDDGRVVLDVVVHGRMFDRSRQGPERQAITFERWTCDPVAATVVRQELSRRGQEFPRFDERRTGQPYRYAYTVGADLGAVGPQPLLRHDLERGTTEVHDLGGHHLPGEAVFVSRGPEAAEDAGWLICFVTDLHTQRSELVVLDAQDLSSPALARVQFPVRVPLGFHGNWIDDMDLAQRA